MNYHATEALFCVDLNCNIARSYLTEPVWAESGNIFALFSSNWEWGDLHDSLAAGKRSGHKISSSHGTKLF